MSGKLQYVLAAVLLVLPSIVLAETGSIVRTTQMVESPNAGARPMATLYGESRVEILERDGGWYQVKNLDDGRIGWVRLTSVRLGEQTAEENETSFWGSLFSFSGGSSSRTATATTGIRGLGEDDITGSVPDQGAVYSLDRFYSDAEDARRFANQLGLQEQTIQHLPIEAEE